MVDTSSLPQPPADPRWSSPQVCRISRPWSVALMIMGAAGFLGGLVGTIYWGVLDYDPPPSGIQGRVIMAIATIGWMIMGTYFVLGSFKYRVLLERDSITSIGIFFDKKLLRSDVVAKMKTMNGITTVRLTANELSGNS
jgi:hypothetical protein